MKTPNLAAALSISGILVLSLFAWYSGDDLCFRNELVRYTVIKKAWLQYMHWDGRSLGIPSLIQLTALKYLPAPVISLIWSMAFIASALMVLKILQFEIPGSVSLPALGMLSAVMWMGMWKLVPDILYWPTGGWYTIMMLLALIWIYFFSKDIQVKNFHAWHPVFIFFLSIVCGNNSHNLVIPLLFLATIGWMQQRLVLNEKTGTYYFLSAIAGLTISACMVLFSPGNGERLKAIGWRGFDWGFIQNCLLVFARYCYWLFALFALMLYIRWLSGRSIHPVSMVRVAASHFRMTVQRKQWVAYIHQHRFLFAAFLSVVVFSATSHFAVPRTAAFFALFLIMHWLQQNHISFNAQSKRIISGNRLLLTVFPGLLFYQLMKVNALKDEIKAREVIYKTSPGMDISVKPIPDSKVPFAFTFVDISPDTAHWVNRCLALHEELKTVRTSGSDTEKY